VLDFDIPKTVLVFSGRPDLEHSVLEIIAGIELGSGLPEDEVALAENVKSELRSLAAELSLSNAHDAYSKFSILFKRCLCTHSTAELKAIITDSKDEQHGHHMLKSAEFEFFEILEELMPGAFSDDEIDELVNHFDVNGDGHVSLDNFRVACFEMLSAMNDSTDLPKVELSTERVSTEDLITLGRISERTKADTNDKSEDHLRDRLGTKSSNRALEASISPKAMKNWKLLYCGGSQPVVDALTAISTRIGIEFHTEKFDW
jgi:Ca2+-binding EF-hand superfamily protein